MRILFTTLIFSLFSLSKLVAQGTMHKQNGHFTAHLDFLGNYPIQNSAGHIKGSSLDYGNGFTNTDQKKYTEKGVTVYGLVKSAVLKVDWWALFGEPTELYQFEWISSGYYDISFNSKGKLVTTKINKNDLAKYPDLLKRFNNLAPSEMAFEIKWKMGKPTEADIKKLEEKYTLDANFYSGLGNNNLNTNRIYKTDIKSSSLLFEPTGETPFATPTIRSRKDFLGISQEDHTDTDIKRILSWWNFCQIHTIDGFNVVKLDWPIDEMKAIAEKYLAYENGVEEPTPKEQIAKAEEKNKSTQAYAKDDFWGDVVKEENIERNVRRVGKNNNGNNFEIFETKTGKISYSQDNTYIQRISNNIFISRDLSNNSKPYRLIDHKGKIKHFTNYSEFNIIKFIVRNDEGKDFESWTIDEKLNQNLRKIACEISLEKNLVRENLFCCFGSSGPIIENKNYNVVYDYVMNYRKGNCTVGYTWNFYIEKIEKIYLNPKNLSIMNSEIIYRSYH